jgi:hypothetical protein
VGSSKVLEGKIAASWQRLELFLLQKVSRNDLHVILVPYLPFICLKLLGLVESVSNVSCEFH